MKTDSKIIIYEAPNDVQVQAKLENEDVWLTQEQMALLFNRDRRTISLHISNIFSEGELDEQAVCQDSWHDTQHGAMPGKTKRVRVRQYNLDVIISVGYRAKSQEGTRFRQWATKRIKEYIVKGFILDDSRLKQVGGHSRYFEELLQRIRDIRASERNFYQKITDIYATSIDYNKDKEITQKFFATVQNKMHYAVHGKTAAELIMERADSKMRNMGLMSFQGDYLTKSDTRVAKNYLRDAEINQLNLIVTLYLDFAELQATTGRLMKMADWVQKLDEFLKVSEKPILLDAGRVSHAKAMEKAEREFEEYKANEDKTYISDFDKQAKKITAKNKNAGRAQKNNNPPAN